MQQNTMDGLAAHLRETTASTGLEGTLDEPIGLPVPGALAALSLLAGGVLALWALGSWLLA